MFDRHDGPHEWHHHEGEGERDYCEDGDRGNHGVPIRGLLGVAMALGL